MKVKDFLDNINDSLLDKIEVLSNELNEKREFKKYRDFEDILLEESEKTVSFFIQSTIKSLPENFTIGHKI